LAASISAATILPTLSLIHIVANGVERLTNPELELFVL
jgi:hypothetical protein